MDEADNMTEFSWTALDKFNSASGNFDIYYDLL